jgi:putative ABC transport system permease protein
VGAKRGEKKYCVPTRYREVVLTRFQVQSTKLKTPSKKVRKPMLKDIRYSIRTLLRQPAFTLIAVITLALAIGANTAIFSVVNTVLLRALPFKNPEQLVSIGKSASSEGLPGLAAYEYLAWSQKSQDFESLAAYSNDNANLTGLGQPERVSCGQVTASFFPTLGIPPLRGRVFLPDEDKPGNSRAVIIGESYWQRRFGRDESIIGRSLILDDKNYVVVGVMPRTLRFPNEYDIWVPLALDPVRETQGDFFSLVEVVGRLNPNASIEHAQSELTLLSQQSTQQSSEKLEVRPTEILPLHQFLVTGVRKTVLLLWAAVGLVMLLACVNVASLMLSRTAARQREMAVRAAVGARRWQLVRQLLVESVVLGVAAGAVGIVIALWCKGLIASLVPEGFTSAVHDLNATSIDWRVFAFTLALSIVTGIVFGLVPALMASKPNLVRTFRDSGSRSLLGFGLRSVKGWLVVAELALAMVLLLSAGLLVRSFNQRNAIDLGFARQNVLTLRYDLPRSKYPTPAQVNSFHHELLDRIKALPGVDSAGIISHKPLSEFSIIAFMGIEGQGELDRKKEKPVGVGTTSSDYFRTLKIPLLGGRAFDDRDLADSPKVGIVNQAFANRYFGGNAAIGKHVGFGCKEDLCRTIVGVVGNIRQENLTDEAVPELYVPLTQMPINSMTLSIHTSADPLSLANTVRDLVLAIDRNQPIYDVRTMDQRVMESLSVSRALMFLFSAFAVLALMLASVGIYGLISYSVSQRTHEIGIRLALGAQRGHVLNLILRTGVTLALSGIVIGVAGAFVLTRLLTSLLYGVTPTDTTTFVAVSLGLFAIAIAACLIPARRATRVEPVVALRHD